MPSPREGFGAIRRSEIERLAGLSAHTKWLWTCLKVMVPPWGKRVARSDLAKLADMHHRTVRRGLDRLEEAGLIAIDRTAGGAHASTNTIWIISPAGEKTPDAGEKEPDEPAPCAPAEQIRGPEISTPAPAIDEALRAVYPGDVDALDEETRRQLARHYGIGMGVEQATAAPTASAAPDQEADRMVREFHDYVRGDPAHVPLVREVQRARKLLEAHGRDAWPIVRRACDALKKAGLHERAGTFLYLGPWITRAGGRWT